MKELEEREGAEKFFSDPLNLYGEEKEDEEHDELNDDRVYDRDDEEDEEEVIEDNFEAVDQLQNFLKQESGGHTRNNQDRLITQKNQSNDLAELMAGHR